MLIMSASPVLNFINNQMKSEEARLRSFSRWSLSYIRPADLARAGFYLWELPHYVKCAFCNQEVYHWTPGDNPITLHSLYNPRCPFICYEDVGNIPIESPREERGYDVVGNFTVENLHGEIHSDSDESTSRIAWTDSDITDANPSTSVNVEEVVEEILVQQQVEAQDPPSIASCERLACKVCLEYEMSIIFIPCLHLASCYQCADRLDNCPICRETVLANMKIFIS